MQYGTKGHQGGNALADGYCRKRLFGEKLHLCMAEMQLSKIWKTAKSLG
jgi:hypothetical protein